MFTVAGLVLWSQAPARPTRPERDREASAAGQGLWRPERKEGPCRDTTAVRDVIIIGSGPAGLTAAVYTARANLRRCVLEGEPSSTSDQPGGQLMLTTDVENYPGFPDGIMGPELMMNMRAQAERFGAEIETVKATRVDLSARPFGVWVGDPDAAEPTYRAKAIIVSTGARSLMLGVPGEAELLGHGVSTCATCDGFFFRGQRHRRGRRRRLGPRGGQLPHQVRRHGHPRPPPRRAAGVEDHAGPGHGQPEDRVPVEQRRHRGPRRTTARSAASTSRTSVTGERSARLDVTGLFVAIGHQPNTDLFKGQLAMEDNGYLITEPGSTRTNVEGVFACGDVQDHTYRQAITAAGSGCMAAIDVERWLESQH